MDPNNNEVKVGPLDDTIVLSDDEGLNEPRGVAEVKLEPELTPLPKSVAARVAPMRVRFSDAQVTPPTRREVLAQLLRIPLDFVPINKPTSQQETLPPAVAYPNKMRLHVGAANKRHLLPQLLKPCDSVSQPDSLQPRLVIDETPRTPTTTSYIPPMSPLPEPMDQEDQLPDNDALTSRCHDSQVRSSEQISTLTVTDSSNDPQTINDTTAAHGTPRTAAGYRALFNLSQLSVTTSHDQSLNSATGTPTEMRTSSLSSHATENIQPPSAEHDVAVDHSPTDQAETEAAL